MKINSLNTFDRISIRVKPLYFLWDQHHLRQAHHGRRVSWEINIGELRFFRNFRRRESRRFAADIALHPFKQIAG